MSTASIQPAQSICKANCPCSYSSSRLPDTPRKMHNALPQASKERNALIFRSDLLAYAETFIPAQAEKFRIFTPFYTGLRRVDGLKLPEKRTLQPNSSRSI